MIDHDGQSLAKYGSAGQAIAKCFSLQAAIKNGADSGFINREFGVVNEEHLYHVNDGHIIPTRNTLPLIVTPHCDN